MNEFPLSVILGKYTSIRLPIEMTFYTHWFNRMFHGDEASSNVSPKVAGNFATEMYGAKKSSFWLSMSYDQDMVRVDPYWFAHNYDWNDRRKREYFTNFWEALLGIDDKVRLHWGKYLPTPGQMFKNGKTFNLEYLKKAYPKMKCWLELQNEHDPNQVFVTKYWREILDIKPMNE